MGIGIEVDYLSCLNMGYECGMDKEKKEVCSHDLECTGLLKKAFRRELTPCFAPVMCNLTRTGLHVFGPVRTTRNWYKQWDLPHLRFNSHHWKGQHRLLTVLWR